jgi:hypothetical protein
LDAATREFFEPKLRMDLTGVRVHTGQRAAESARQVNALAYTVGRHIAFDSSAVAPESHAGRKLLAHELTHVAQQGLAATIPPPGRLPIAPTGTALEREAHATEAAVQTNGITQRTRSASNTAVQRQTPGTSPAPAPGTGPAPPPAPAPAKTYPFKIDTDGCEKPPFNDAMVRAGARLAFDQVVNTNCVMPGPMREQLLNKFNGLTIECEQGTNKPCGRAARHFTQTVNVYPPAMDPSICGSLASTILHEAVHLTEWWPFGHGETADACEKSCFGFGSGDASKCNGSGSKWAPLGFGLTGAGIGAGIGAFVGPLGALIGAGIGAFAGVIAGFLS